MIKLADGRGHLYQWDTGRQVECDAEQVHFSNHHYGTSIDVEVKNGKATIPNQLLTSAIPLKAWAWVKDDNGEYTKEEQVFLVAKRNKPSDYVYTPTEIKTWQDLQNQIGDLNGLKTEHKDNLVNAINDAAGSSGAGDFIIKMTVSDANEVVSCDTTFAQLDAAYKAGKNPVVVVNTANDNSEGETYLPLLEALVETFYIFGLFYNGQTFTADADPDAGWSYTEDDLTATAIKYTNSSMPNVGNVWAALDSLVTQAHTHSNKAVIDKLSVADGKLKYDGSDVGLKGDKGDPGKTPVKGTDYWTKTDKAEIVTDTLAALPTWTGGNY